MATDIAWVLNNNPKYEGCAWFLTDDKSLENLNWGSTKDENDNSIPKPTQEELDEYFNGPNKSFKDYKSHYSIINFFTKIVQFFGIEKRVIQ